MSSIKPWNPDLAINFGGLEILSLVSVFESIELFVVEISIDISLLRKRRRFLANDEKRKVCATQVEHALCCTRARNSWPRQVTESRLRGIFIARWKYTILPVSGYAIFNWYIWPVSESGGNLTRFFIYLTNEKKRTDGVGVVAAHLGTRGAGWPRWWTCWKNWITPEWSLSRPRTRRVERTVSSEFIKLYIP